MVRFCIKTKDFGNSLIFWGYFLIRKFSDPPAVHRTNFSVLQEVTLLYIFRRVVQYVQYGVDEGYETVVIRTPDSDLLFTLLQYCHTWQTLHKLIYDVGTAKFNNTHFRQIFCVISQKNQKL